jgi:hypothetical protein
MVWICEFTNKKEKEEKREKLEINDFPDQKNQKPSKTDLKKVSKKLYKIFMDFPFCSKTFPQIIPNCAQNVSLKNDPIPV